MIEDTALLHILCLTCGYDRTRLLHTHKLGSYFDSTVCHLEGRCRFPSEFLKTNERIYKYDITSRKAETSHIEKVSTHLSKSANCKLKTSCFGKMSHKRQYQSFPMKAIMFNVSMLNDVGQFDYI